MTDDWENEGGAVAGTERTDGKRYLVRVTHLRCMEADGRTLVFAPVGWDAHRIEAEVEAAQADYERAVREARELPEGPPAPTYSPDYDAHPDKTVAEVKAAHEEAKRAYREHRDRARPLERRFEEFLRERGFTSIWDDGPHVTDVDLDWGHQHGIALRYGETDGTDTFRTTPLEAAKQQQQPTE